MGRELRTRKPAVYNLEQLEKDQRIDYDNENVDPRRQGRGRAAQGNDVSKPRGQRVSGEDGLPAFPSDSDADDFQPPRGRTNVQRDGVDDEEEEEVEGSARSSSDDDFTNKPGKLAAKRLRENPLPQRRQPRRVAAAVCLKEDDSDSDHDEDDLPISKIQRTQRGSARRASLEETDSGTEGRSSSGTGTANSNSDDEMGVEEAADTEEGSPESSHKSAQKGRAIEKATQAKTGKGSRSRGDQGARPGLLQKLKGTAKVQKQKGKKIVKKGSAKGSLQKRPAVPPPVVEKILDLRTLDGEDEAFVKFQGKSYRHAKWLPTKEVLKDKGQLLRNFQQRRAHGLEIDEYGELENGIKPDWLQVQRVIAQRGPPKAKEYLVKWRNLDYGECTWEAESNLVDDQAHITQFKAREQRKAGPTNCKLPKKGAIPAFRSGRMLRDYQVESLNWIMDNMRAERNCILADEMGLGKTAQSIAVLEFHHQLLHKRGPFLVIAPTTTLGHWQREIETWTDMYVVQYTGGPVDRQLIKDHELYHKDGGYKFNVLLSSYELVLKDERVFANIPFETVVIDEAHRMKSTGSQQRGVIDRMMAAGNIKFLLLLTGTPVQNNLRELYGILSLLDSDKYSDEAEFFEKYGGDSAPPTIDQVKALQDALRPILLRRMKEDVETLPEKEEVIVWVELTTEQRHYYKAIYSQQIGTLLSGASAKNMPNLRNLAMELRKVCCHPYLCNGLEDDILARQLARGDMTEELDRMVTASGKMVLLAKLLPKLRADGHKVLIFSQFKIMLDVLEDALRGFGYPLERIDGSVAQKDRQAAIDRFSKGESDSFIFLLSTRAGGQGITLTAADTVIIYDSDWNPQNDLQAMARCHRIGQSKEVTIYRLISRDTYEAKVFEASTRKYGLDEALLGSMTAMEDPEADNKRIADLLRHGAHGLVGHEEDKAQDGEAFQAEGIDAILAGRTMKRSIGSRKGNTFSMATFTVDTGPQDGENFDDRAYWASLMPEAVAAHDEQVAAAARPVELAKRERKVVNYNERARGKEQQSSDDEYDAVKEDDEEGGQSDKARTAEKVPEEKREKKEKEKAPKVWSKAEVRIVEDVLLMCGPLEDMDAQAAAWEKAGLRNRSAEETLQVRAVLLQLIQRAAQLWDGRQKQQKALADWHKSQQVASYFGNRPAQPEPVKKDWDAEPLFMPGIVSPPLADRALTAGDTEKRIRKNGRKYLDMLDQREEFVKAWEACVLTGTPETQEQKIESMQRVVVPNVWSLPEWWEHSHDMDLLETMYEEGYDSRKAREFADGFLTRPGSVYASLVCKAPEEAPSDDLPITALAEGCKTAAPDEEQEQAKVLSPEEWQTLQNAVATRIRHLLLALTDPVASHRMRCIAKKKARAVAEAKRTEEANRKLNDKRMAEMAADGEAQQDPISEGEDDGFVGAGGGVARNNSARPGAHQADRSPAVKQQAPKGEDRPVYIDDLDSDQEDDSDVIGILSGPAAPAPQAAKRIGAGTSEQGRKTPRRSEVRSPSAKVRGTSRGMSANDRPSSAKTRVMVDWQRPRSGSTTDSSRAASVKPNSKEPLKALDPNRVKSATHNSSTPGKFRSSQMGKVGASKLKQSTLNFGKRPPQDNLIVL